MTAEEDFGQENAAPEALVQVETVATPAVDQEKAQGAVAETAPDVLDEFQPLPLRRRLRELLSVPSGSSDAASRVIELESPGGRGIVSRS